MLFCFDMGLVVSQASLEPQGLSNPPTSASQVLGVQMHATTPASDIRFFSPNIFISDIFALFYCFPQLLDMPAALPTIFGYASSL